MSSTTIPIDSNSDDMISLLGELNPNNSHMTYEKSDNSIAINVNGSIKFDFSNGKYIFYLKSLLDKQESNPLEFLDAMKGMIVEDKRFINDGKQVEFFIRWDIQDLTLSQLNILKQNLHPLEINIYKDSEMENLSGEYYLGLVYDFDDKMKIILEKENWKLYQLMKFLMKN